MFGDIKIFTGNANKPFAKAVCDHIGTELGKCKITKFSNDNIKVKILETVRGKDVYIIQPSCIPVNTGLMELFIMIDAVKNSSAARVTAVCPYYPYARSDKKDEPRISITARLIADFLQTSGADRVMAMNFHSDQIQGFFRIPSDNLLAGKTFCDYLKNENKEKGLNNHVIVAPDSGSAKLSGFYARKLNIPLSILDKRRYNDDEKPVIEGVIGCIKDKDCIIFDDEVASAGSLKEASKVLIQEGARSIIACCVHGVLSGNAIKRIADSPLKKLIITDTVFIPEEKKIDKLKILSVSELFAKAIKRTNIGESISSLYEID